MKKIAWNKKTAAVLGLLAAACIAAVVLVPSKKPEASSFQGHYKYRFKLSSETAADYQVTATFRDEAHTTEVVFVHPKSLSSTDVMNTPESAYAEKGVVRLEVNPNSAYPAKAQDKLVEAFAYAAKKTLDERHADYKLASLEGAPLPGFAIEIRGPHPVTQVFMKGRTVHYLFTAAGDSRPLHEMLSSLEDP
jgi:hypothetical protein